MEGPDRWSHRPRFLPQERELRTLHVCLCCRGLDLLQRGELRRAADCPAPRV